MTGYLPPKVEEIDDAPGELYQIDSDRAPSETEGEEPRVHWWPKLARSTRMTIRRFELQRTNDPTGLTSLENTNRVRWNNITSRLEVYVEVSLLSQKTSRGAYKSASNWVSVPMPLRRAKSSPEIHFPTEPKSQDQPRQYSNTRWKIIESSSSSNLEESIATKNKIRVKSQQSSYDDTVHVQRPLTHLQTNRPTQVKREEQPADTNPVTSGPQTQMRRGSRGKTAVASFELTDSEWELESKDSKSVHGRRRSNVSEYLSEIIYVALYTG
jgi:hypothetical protein